MQKISLTLGQALRRSIFVLGLMLLISVSSLFLFVQQPSYAVTSAASKLTPEEKINRAYIYNEAAGIREEERQEAYEQAIKDAESPATMEKAYERNEKAYEKENPQPNLIEKAEELVEKVIGK